MSDMAFRGMDGWRSIPLSEHIICGGEFPNGSGASLVRIQVAHLIVRSMVYNHRDTIFALSSGRPPAAIAVVRVSGPRAQAAVKLLAGRLPQPRRASLLQLRNRKSKESSETAG